MKKQTGHKSSASQIKHINLNKKNVFDLLKLI